MRFRQRAPRRLRFGPALSGLVLALGLAGLIGCGSEAGSPVVGRVQWLPPEPERAPVSTVRHRVRPTDGARAWQVEDADEALLVVPPYDVEGPKVLRLKGPERLVIAVPGPISAAVTGIEVSVFTRHRTAVSLELTRSSSAPDEPFEILQKQLKNGAPAPKRLVFRRLPGIPGEPDFESLRIIVGAGGGLVFLHSVTFLEGRPEDGLPDARSSAELAFMGREGRRAVALTSARPLVVQVAQAAGQILALDAGVPREFFARQLNPRLRVRAVNEGGSRLERTLSLSPGDWRSLQVDLSELGPGPARVTLKLLAARPAVALVGDARWLLSAPETRPAPLVLLVSSDTHRADHLGLSSGSLDVRTPNLDALAGRGVRFLDAWSSSNITLPSHSALLTGLHPRDSGIVDNGTTLARAAHTLAESFAQGGYGTFGVVSSAHLSDTISGFGQGFDRFLETTRTAENAADSVRALKGWLEAEHARPVFAFLHLFDAHAPYQPPQVFAAAAAVGEPGSMQAMRALYRAEVAYLDDCLGELLELPRVRAGIVAVTADHGESLGAHGIAFGHAELYPDTLHVPLLLSWPGAPEGLAVGGAVRQQDIGRSLLDLSGLGALYFPGQSLLPFIEAGLGTGPQPQQSTYAIASGAASASIRARGWLLVLHLTEHSPGPFRRARLYGRHEVELFHLAEDPGALTELLAKHPQRAAELREQLIGWLRSAQPAGVSEKAQLDAASISALEQLGYGEGDLGSAEERGSLFPAGCDCERCASF